MSAKRKRAFDFRELHIGSTIAMVALALVIGWSVGRYQIPRLMPEWMPLRLQIEWRHFNQSLKSLFELSTPPVVQTEDPIAHVKEVAALCPPAEINAKAFDRDSSESLDAEYEQAQLRLQQLQSEKEQRLQTMLQQEQQADRHCATEFDSWLDPNIKLEQPNWADLLPASQQFFDSGEKQNPKELQQLLYDISRTDNEYSAWAQRFMQKMELKQAEHPIYEDLWTLQCGLDLCVLWGQYEAESELQWQQGFQQLQSLLAELPRLSEGSLSEKSLLSPNQSANRITFAWVVGRSPELLHNPGYRALSPQKDIVQ